MTNKHWLNMPLLMGHLSSVREREKMDRSVSKREEREKESVVKKKR